MLYIPSKMSESKRLWKQKKEALYSFPEYVSTQELPFPEASQVELYEKLFWFAFSELPDTCQKVLLLKWRDYSNREISDLLHIPVDRIQELKSKCTRTFISKVKSHKEYSLLTEGSLIDK